MTVTVGLVEDHSEFRQSMNFLINSSRQFSVQWAYASVEEAINKYTPVDIILLDINLPGLSGIEAITIFKQKEPIPKIIMLTILEDDLNVLEAIKNGADGYILKKTAPASILQAINQVSEGGAALTPMIARQVMSFLRPESSKTQSPTIQLTPRENEILVLITQGTSTGEIAETLFISAQTVRNHIKSIYEKLHVHSRAQVVAKAYRDNIIRTKN